MLMFVCSDGTCGRWGGLGNCDDNLAGTEDLSMVDCNVDGGIGGGGGISSGHS